jgi:ferredoxin
MKVVVDYELCEANAICMRVLPEVFRVDDQDKLHLLMEEPPEALRDRLKEAVRRCPRQALSIKD